MSTVASENFTCGNLRVRLCDSGSRVEPMVETVVPWKMETRYVQMLFLTKKVAGLPCLGVSCYEKDK